MIILKVKIMWEKQFNDMLIHAYEINLASTVFKTQSL